MILSASETINILNFEEKLYICPFITPLNLVYTNLSGKSNFCIIEIFLEVHSINEEIEVEINTTNEWLVPEFQNKKHKISFASNICCLGYILYYIFFNKNPFKDEKERKENRIPKIPDKFPFKELIEKCTQINYKDRWSIEEIQQYINEKIFEEKFNFEELEISKVKNDEKDIYIFRPKYTRIIK